MGPVANRAKRGPMNCKQNAKLSRRLADFAAMIANGSREEGPSKRRASGGYRRPGSLKK